MENKVIQSKVTKGNIQISIPKEFIIKDFNEMMEGVIVKGNRKNKFLEEFAKNLTEYIEVNDVLVDIYEKLLEGENVKCLDEE